MAAAGAGERSVDAGGGCGVRRGDGTGSRDWWAVGRRADAGRGRIMRGVLRGGVDERGTGGLGRSIFMGVGRLEGGDGAGGGWSFAACSGCDDGCVGGVICVATRGKQFFGLEESGEVRGRCSMYLDAKGEARGFGRFSLSLSNMTGVE